MSTNNFNAEFNNTKNKVKIIFRIVLISIVLIFLGYMGLGIWTYNTINDNGGVQKTITDIVRTVKQIDKDSDTK